MRYRMYIDECGNPDLGSSDNPIHRFLSLTGVIVNLEYAGTTLHSEIESLKHNHFGSHPDEPVILHRKEILNARGPFVVLRNNENKRRLFDEDLLQLLKTLEYTVVTVCLDKKAHKETYQVWRYEPYHYCLALLFERYSFFLHQKKSQGDVLAESRGGKEDRALKDSFSNLMENGTQYLEREHFEKVLTSKQLKVKPKSNNISGLQLADIIAHPSRHEILCENGKTDREIAPFGREVVNILGQKYYQNAGKIYGKKFLP